MSDACIAQKLLSKDESSFISFSEDSELNLNTKIFDNENNQNSYDFSIQNKKIGNLKEVSDISAMEPQSNIKDSLIISNKNPLSIQEIDLQTRHFRKNPKYS